MSRDTSAIFFFIMLMGLLPSCKPTSSSNDNVSWESGHVIIPADQNLKNILEQFNEAFENQYPKATVEYQFEPNDSLIKRFGDGIIHSMIITRALTKNEIEFSSIAQGIKVKENIFGLSGIALIANNNFNDSVFDLQQVKKYLQEKNIEMVFDNAQSGMAKYIMQKLSLDVALMKNAKSVGTTDDVIYYIQHKENAVGFIPFSYISDGDDKKVRTILNSVKLMDVKWNDTITSISQESIAYGDYPLKQPVNFVLGGRYEPVADGFASYLLKERAAKILLKAGLVPVNMPVRNYNMHDEIPVNE